MKVINARPPNYDLICAALTPSPDAVFCYGKTIFNPSDRPITPDVELHEEVHSKQQGTNVDLWYNRYLTDSSFRLSQELEAYGKQYAFIKKHMHGEMLEWGLDKMAEALSSETYGNLLTYGEARSKIRNHVSAAQGVNT